VRTNWNPEDYEAFDQCTICMETFEEKDQVTPLPCSGKHYFHSDCVVQWFEKQEEG